ncbi:MAG: RNA methyltransferase [Chloroflexi bacterium]|nr:RNA methyltransferase [Chloroflexota bacterium]MCL5076439.1 RNA methyltransferase [Chloroflexota bacterium]
MRRRERCFVVEGVRLVEETFQAGITPVALFFNRELLARTARGRNLLEITETGTGLEVSERVLHAIAGTVAPQGIVAVLPFPASHRVKEDLGTLVLVIDGLHDAGNLGTILRSALAADVRTVILTADTVDVYSPKVVRAAMGAHFHLGLLVDWEWEQIATLLCGWTLLVTSAQGGRPYYEVDWAQPTAMVIGSEAEGVSAEALRHAHGSVHIPMAGQVESLNAAVAASIILFEAYRQQSKQKQNREAVTKRVDGKAGQGERIID